MTPGAVVIEQVAGRYGIRDWCRVPYTVFVNDECWVPPLLVQERQRIDPRHNPFFQFGEAIFFVAYRNGAPVGRISAQVNRRHLARYDDDTGHFGFFDCIHDPDVAAALIAAARDWLGLRGLRKMAGPYNLTINEDVGLLVSGFDTKPAILSSQAPRWAGTLLEGCGFSKSMDLFAYRMSPSTIPAQIARLAEMARRSSRIRVRQFDLSRYAQDVALIFKIFNDAWRDNWGFVPFAKEEIETLVKETRPFMRARFGRIVDIDGIPAAMTVVLPNLNEVIASFQGRLLPFNWAVLLYAIRRDKWRTARVPLLGIRREFRNTPLSTAVLALLVAELMDLGKDYNLDWVEFSWVLENNRAMVSLAELASGAPSRTYRVYEKAL